jgi:hypothetical protein
VNTLKRIALGLCLALIYSMNIAPTSAAEKITLVITDDQIGGYSRNLFKHWIDVDKDGCNTRYEVLIAEAVVKPKVGAGCYLTGGRWRSSYDGKVFTNPTGLDIDHMVPLAEAWRSGAWAWTAAQRMDFANDLEDSRSLLAVTASLNRSKGDRDVAAWLPAKAQCSYISNWIAVKWRFDLSVDPIEGEFLQTKITACKLSNVEISN